MAPSELRAIKARFYWQGELKFTSNDEAFLFFYLLSQALNCEECHFSEALSQVSDAEARKVALQKYLATESPMYGDVAEMMASGNVFEGISKKKVTVFNEFSAYINQGSDPIPIHIQSGEDDDQIEQFLKNSMSGMEGRDFIYFHSLQDDDLKKYMLLQELKELSRQRFISKGVKPELHIIDPRYIALFKTFNTEEIEFVECRITEFRKKEATVEAYEEITTVSYDDILNASNSTRFFELYVTSVRLVEKGRMKYRYYSGELKLKSKQPTAPQIKNAITSQLRTKEDRMIKDHY